jgi:spore germination protein GerM
VIAAVVAAAVASWALFWGLPALFRRGAPQQGGASQPAAGAARKINATLFFTSPDGQNLVAVRRDVPYGATPAEQARHIVAAQLGAAPSGQFSPIPQGTTLRAVFLSASGEAFVDLSPEVAANHSGGSLAELFTIYSIVNALTVSLPSVTSVQILVDGREVETLAGHVDLRHPLPKNTTWVTQ